MNDEAEKQLAPDTPADTLHAHAANHIALPHDKKFENEPLMDEVTSHPNLRADTIKDLYAHATEHMNGAGREDLAGHTEAGNMSNEQLGNLLNHPNAPASIKQDFALKSWHPENPNSDLHEELADSGILDDAQLRTMAENALDAGSKPHAYKHLSPEYYLGKFKARSQQSDSDLPESEHERAEQEYHLGRQGLLASSKHNPQTLEQTIDAFSKDTRGHHGPTELLNQLVQEREDLSKDQLNKIHQHVESDKDEEHNYRQSDAIDSILKHKNVDPTLLSKYAVGKDIRSDALEHPNLPRQSIDAFIKRVKDPNSYGFRSNIESLLKNPNLTEKDVKALVDKGSTDALHDPRAKEEDVRNAWNKSDKGLDAARGILSASNVPPDVLKELVNHKNQDVAIGALQHQKADLGVVQEGLKRKAKAVSDEARLHPLVAQTEARAGLMSGKVGLTKAYKDEDYKNHFDQMPAEDQQKVFMAADAKYKGDKLDSIAKTSKERPENVVYSKYKLASDPRAPQAVREAHSRDLSNMFRDNVAKNVEPDETKNNILSEDHKTDNGRVIKAVVSLAANGDKEAQSAILENPGMMHALSGHLNYDEQSPDFLSKIYDKIKEHKANGATVFNRHGTPEPFDSGMEVSSPLFDSKNTPTHIFQEMASDKDTMEKLGQGDQMNRYNDLPEAEQNQKYAQILAAGSPEANLSILRAKAPAQSWNSAFTNISDVQRRKFLENNMEHVQSHRPDIFKNSALGLYNKDSDGANFSADHGPQGKAIQRMNANSTIDQDTLKQIMQIPQDATGYFQDNNLSLVPKAMYTRDDNMANHAFSIGRNDLGYAMTAGKFKKDIENAPYAKYNSNPAEQAQAQVELQGTVDRMNARVAELPFMPTDGGPSDNAMASKWESILEGLSGGQYDKNKLHSLKERGANLDFLADMSGTSGERLKTKALKEDLISTQKLADIAANGTINDVLSVNDGNKRQAMLQSFLANPNVNENDLALLARKINHGFLNPEAYGRGRRKSMSEAALGTFNERTNNLIDLFQAKAPKELPQLLAGLTRNGSSAGRNAEVDALTNDDKDSIFRNIVQHISSKPYASPAEKNANMYSVLKSLGEGVKGAAGITMNSIEKNVLADKDFTTMIRMANSGDLSDRGMAQLSKLASQPDTLNAGQIADLSQQLDYDSSTESVVGMAKAFESKIGLETRGAVAAQHKLQFLKHLQETLNTSISGDKVKNDFVINYTKRAALDPHTAKWANGSLAGISYRLADTDLNQAVDLFTSLPSENTDILPSEMPEDMANDPRVVENSSTGWKLAQLANNADKLTGANASIVVNRALSDSGDRVSKVGLFSNLERNEFTQAEDSIKLGRAMSAQEFNHALNDMAHENSLEGNLVYVAHARLGDLQNAVKDPTLIAPSAPMMGDEHRMHIATNARALSRVIEKAKFTDDLNNAKDKMSKVSEIINTLHQNLSAVADSLVADAERGAPSSDANLVNENILATAEAISSSGLKLDREDALKVMDLVKRHDEVYNASDDAGEPRSGDVVSNIVQRAENFEDQDWKQAFESDPHAQFYLSMRDSIPTSALNSVDYKALENHKEEDGDESSIQSSFAEETRKWFGKMSPDDLPTHGKNLLHMYTRMQNDQKINHAQYSKSMAEGMKYLGNQLTHQDTMDLLKKTKDSAVRQDLYKKAVSNGVGGVETLKQFVRDNGDELPGFGKNSHKVVDYQNGDGPQLRHMFEPILKSPHIDEELSSKMYDLFAQKPAIMKESAIELMKNKATHAKAVTNLATFLIKNHKADYKEFQQRSSADVAKELMQHPNLDESQMVELFNITNENFPKYMTSKSQFNPALMNPTHGGKLFRAIPIQVPPEVPNAETSKCTPSVSLQHKDYKRMQEVMSMIPPEGMAWAEFKRKFPKEEKSLPNSVKQVFTSNNNKPVMPEQFAQAARALDDNGKKYHLTYSKWATSDFSNMPQMHRANDGQKPNLVVQVNNSPESEKTLSQDPKLWSFYQHMLQMANGISGNQIGLHPTTPHLVSWSRVDTDQGKDAWAVEEHQSDVAQKMRRNIRSLISKAPSGMQINGQLVTPDEMKKYASVLDKHLEDWQQASMQAVIDNAKSHGLKKLYMHGAELRGLLSGIGESREVWDNPNTKAKMSGFLKTYQEAPLQHGFKECDYTDYPKHSTKMLKNLQDKKLSTKCWVLDLSDAPPKKARKPNL